MPIKANLTQASSLLKAFHSTIEQAKYHEASDLFDRLDEVWETLERQLNLPVSNSDTLVGAPLLPSSRQRSAQFNQTWSSSSGAMPGGGFSGGMSMSFGGGNSGAGGGISMSSSSGPNGQFRFKSSATPGQGFMGQSMGPTPPQMIQHQILMQSQRIQMTLMALKISLQGGNWKMAQAHARRLSPLFVPLAPPDNLPLEPKTRARQRTLNLSVLPPAQQTALKTKVQQAKAHIKGLSTALERQQLEAAYTHIQSLETVTQTLTQTPNNADQLGQPPQE